MQQGAKGIQAFPGCIHIKTQNLRGSALFVPQGWDRTQGLLYAKHMFYHQDTSPTRFQDFTLPDLTNAEMPTRMTALEQQILILIQNATLEDLHTTLYLLAQ